MTDTWWLAIVRRHTMEAAQLRADQWRAQNPLGAGFAQGIEEALRLLFDELEREQNERV